ncbi:YraN family protein [Swaminathania salitolerans]|uniref:UPF0102 protein SSA02_08660 n=1 Tax=Swaminathania salitolerans TaxID=182838 RepID=A0A511BPB4_9PROT|nr:YraN family protein [Swaminathania salitolerans]GBQ13890.1 hypothetical protein AA21291_1654 [Swaminathania salitolerans LMG 21291]GEL01703.1 UPF0102 protein [Swaminathania salitolerans]
MVGLRRDRGTAAYLEGLAAETRSCARLERDGYRILARRLRTPLGEIDIIAANARCLVFLEVKRRRTLDEAAFSLGARQSSRLMSAAEFVFATRPEWRRDETRFDVVLYDNRGTIRWIEAALP